MFHDFKELLSIFNAHKVKYLIVGGDPSSAANKNGVPPWRDQDYMTGTCAVSAQLQLPSSC